MAVDSPAPAFSLSHFATHIGGESGATRLLFERRWPEGFRCPVCEHDRCYFIPAPARADSVRSAGRGLYQCKRCRHQTSLTAGTALAGSRTPLVKWLAAIHLLSSEPGGITATHLQQVLSITYKTAWLMLHKIRHALSAADARKLLSGPVQAGLSYCEEAGHLAMRPTEPGRPVVAAMAMDTQGTPLQLKIKLVEPRHVRCRTLLPRGRNAFQDQHVAPVPECPNSDSTNCHNSSSFNRSIPAYYSNVSYAASKLSFPAVQQAAPDEVVQARPAFSSGAERFYYARRLPVMQYMAEARQWMRATYGGLKRQYLQAYLDEYCFRFNHSCAPENHAFRSLLSICLST
ncbi:IS1595 family transposase [Paenibacillus sp. IB182496]|uniref:IS1595 family transposase n=1 Tax=Paenibacillus sabuli TaxID=2772509 RepID=A0A927GRQ7_9BACL|nr:transposase [Paenibacillus sabuli]MBD2845909.1 IS1595 family transposase [Paenibacillus sabuli]